MNDRRLNPVMLRPDDLDALLESVLARGHEPLTATAIRKALPAGKKPSAKEVADRLHALVDTGHIHRWPGRAQKFSALEAQAFVSDQVRQALTAGPLTEAEVKKHVSKAAQPMVKAVLTDLVDAGRLWRHPKLGKRVPYGLAPPDPLNYLPAAIESAFKPLIKLGFRDHELRAALRQYVGAPDVSAGTNADGTKTDDAILAAMSRLNSQVSRGALVYVAELRAALADQFRDKASFDRAVLGLAGRGQVQLQSHAWPGTLSDMEKEALIANERGGFFDAIGLRLE